MKLADAVRLSDTAKRETASRESKNGELQRANSELEQRYAALQDVNSALRSELAESRAETKAAERASAVLEKDIASMRKDAAARDELYAKMVADMRATAEAAKAVPAAPLCGYSLKIVSRDGNNDPQEYRIVPDKA